MNIDPVFFRLYIFFESLFNFRRKNETFFKPILFIGLGNGLSVSAVIVIRSGNSCCFANTTDKIDHKQRVFGKHFAFGLKDQIIFPNNRMSEQIFPDAHTVTAIVGVSGPRTDNAHSEFIEFFTGRKVRILRKILFQLIGSDLAEHDTVHKPDTGQNKVRIIFLRLTVKCFKHIRCYKIIRIHESDIFSRSQLKCGISRPAGPFILFMYNFYTRVCLFGFKTKRKGVILGIVINENDLYLFEGLRSKRCNASLNIFFYIIHRNNNTDLRLRHVLTP